MAIVPSRAQRTREGQWLVQHHTALRYGLEPHKLSLLSSCRNYGRNPITPLHIRGPSPEKEAGEQTCL